jgi:hypothetical protein
MNERIQAFIDQCTSPNQLVMTAQGKQILTEKFDKEKFAELIVRECIDVAHSEGDDVAYLAQYFGVENEQAP